MHSIIVPTKTLSVSCCSCCCKAKLLFSYSINYNSHTARNKHYNYKIVLRKVTMPSKYFVIITYLDPTSIYYYWVLTCVCFQIFSQNVLLLRFALYWSTYSISASIKIIFSSLSASNFNICMYLCGYAMSSADLAYVIGRVSRRR